MHLKRWTVLRLLLARRCRRSCVAGRSALSATAMLLSHVSKRVAAQATAGPTSLNCSTTGDVRSLSSSPLGDMLAGGGADDTHGLTHGLMAYKTRGSETKVVIWWVSPDKLNSTKCS